MPMPTGGSVAMSQRLATGLYRSCLKDAPAVVRQGGYFD